MAYLSKNERKQQIIESAKKLVLSEGLNTLKVRKLAEKAEFSVGQIHHHFDSIHDLKSQVFLELVHENLNLKQFPENTSCRDKLIYLLGSEAASSETPYIGIWNDAERNAYSHPIFKQAYAQAIKIWQNSIIEILHTGLINHEFIFRLDQINGIALRLIAFAIGLECLSNLDLEEVQADFFHQQILSIIQQELDA